MLRRFLITRNTTSSAIRIAHVAKKMVMDTSFHGDDPARRVGVHQGQPGSVGRSSSRSEACQSSEREAPDARQDPVESVACFRGSAEERSRSTSGCRRVRHYSREARIPKTTAMRIPRIRAIQPCVVSPSTYASFVTKRSEAADGRRRPPAASHRFEDSGDSFPARRYAKQGREAEAPAEGPGLLGTWEVVGASRRQVSSSHRLDGANVASLEVGHPVVCG